MKTLYSACLARLGLSLSGAATLHGSRLDSVKSWASGRRTPPDGVWDDLRKYEAQIVDMSEALREAWDENPAPIEINTSEASDLSMMAAADFILGLPEETAVHDGETATTRLARQARRPN